MTMLSALLTLALLFGRLIDQTDHAYSLHRSREEITDLTCIGLRARSEGADIVSEIPALVYSTVTVARVQRRSQTVFGIKGLIFFGAQPFH